MSLLFTRSKRAATENPVARRLRISGFAGANATARETLRQSAVWAAVRLRADLVSTLPVDVIREVNGHEIEVPTPPVLLNPGGDEVDLQQFLYSTQVDLDQVGNTFGIITERDANSTPARIDLVEAKDVTVKVRSGVVSYRIKNEPYDAYDIWHEKQFTLSGLPIGLSPVAHFAWSHGIYTSAMEFALEWFKNGARTPGGVLKNTAKTLGPGEATAIKERFKASIEARDVFVTGSDWDFSMREAQSSDSRFLEAQEASDRDAARFYGVPGDLIDAAAKGSAITYANITQRNLQFLIMHLNPALRRREKALSKLVTAPRKVRFNRGGILEMDPETSSKVLIEEVRGRVRAPSEARVKLGLPGKFTQDQLDEFAVLFPKGTPTPPPTIGATS